MPGFGLGFVPAFARGRGGGAVSLFLALNGSGRSFEIPPLVLDSEGVGFAVTRTVTDSEGNSFNVS